MRASPLRSEGPCLLYTSLAAGPLQPSNTVATPMARRNSRHIAYFKAQVTRPLTKVHVFKPQWMELCVKTAQPLPHFAPKHQESSRRLFDLAVVIHIAVQIQVLSLIHI